jgi:O-antigen/teichoic acid export membrane protein
MLKAFLKNSAVYGAANMLTRAIQLLLVPLYTRVLTPSDYGSVDMMMVVAAVTLSVLTLEIAQGMARAYGDVTGDDRAPYASTALWFTVGSATVLATVAVVGAPLGRVILGAGMEAAFRVACLAIAAQLFYNLFLVQLRFELRAATYGMTSVLFTVVSNGVAVVLVVVLRTGVIGVFVGQLIGYVTAAAVAGAATRRAYVARFDRAKCREMLAFATPLVFSVIGGHVAMLTDRVVIKSLLGLHEVGVYGIGARVSSTVGLLLSAFGGALSPLIYSRYREADTPTQIARLYRIFLLLVLPILVGLTLFAGEVVRILATPPFYPAADVIPPLALAVMFSGMTIFTPGMGLARKTRLLAVLMVAVAFENVALNFLLIPRLGVMGGAMATMLSAATGFAGFVIASQRYYRVPHRWGRLSLAAAISSAAAAAGYVVGWLALGFLTSIAVKALVWLLALAGLAGALLDPHDRGLVRDRLRALRRPAASDR